MPDEFYGDKTLLTPHETLSLFLIVMSAKLMIFNVIKPSMKLSLRLTLVSGGNRIRGRGALAALCPQLPCRWTAVRLPWMYPCRAGTQAF